MSAQCPFCSEPISEKAVKCRHCGEFLDEGGAPQKKGISGGMLALIIVGGLLVLCLPGVAIVAAIAIPNLIEARKHGNEAAAIGALKTISTAQALYREGDKDGDEVFDYGNLSELGNTMLVDMVLASGTKQGYIFQVHVSPETPEFMWMATATPAVPQTTGDRYFVTNHEGIIFYSPSRAFTPTDDCQIPSDAVPVGR